MPGPTGAVCKICRYTYTVPRLKFHFFTDWLNAVSILLSLFCVQHHHSIQYNFRDEDSLFLRYSIRSSSFFFFFFFIFNEPMKHTSKQIDILTIPSLISSRKFHNGSWSYLDCARYHLCGMLCWSGSVSLHQPNRAFVLTTQPARHEHPFNDLGQTRQSKRKECTQKFSCWLH